MIKGKIKIPNTIGKNIAAVIHKPETKTEKLAILCPGFLDTKDYSSFILLANSLCSHGYTIIRFDPTGTWESEGSIADYSTTQYLKDVKSVLDYMIKDGKYTNVLLGGHSMGGYVSMLYAAQDKRISMVVAIMSPYEGEVEGKVLKTWQKDDFKKSTRDIPDSSAIKEFLVPYSFAKDRLKYNVLDVIKKVHASLLLIAGEKDTTVLPEEIKLIFDIANKPKKMITIPNIGHDYRHNVSEIEKVNNEVISNLYM